MERIVVIGSGQMGSGIAQVAAQAGRKVTLVDVSASQLERARSTIASSLGRLVKKGSLAEEAAAQAAERLAYSTQMDVVGEAELVIEAIVENESAKIELWQSVTPHLGRATLLATNTSTLPVTRLAAATDRPERFIGMHFMNPVPVMQLVEVIRGLGTSDETYAAVRAEAVAYGKTPVLAHDSPGFVSNRVLLPMINEAIFCLMEGVADAEGIDTVMKLGMNHPIGPLALADLIGLDTCLSILEILHHDLGDPKYRPCPLLRTYVSAGYLGRKSGRGFYTY